MFSEEYAETYFLISEFDIEVFFKLMIKSYASFSDNRIVFSMMI